MHNSTIPHGAEKLFSVSAILKILGIPRHRLTYLFEARKLNPDDFLTLDNGQRLFRPTDLEKIKKALFEVSSK